MVEVSFHQRQPLSPFWMRQATSSSFGRLCHQCPSLSLFFQAASFNNPSSARSQSTVGHRCLAHVHLETSTSGLHQAPTKCLCGRKYHRTQRVSTVLIALLHRSYKALSPKTRLFVGVGLMVNAAIAMQFEDQIEDFLSMKSTPEEQKKLQSDMPKVSLIDRGSK